MTSAINGSTSAAPHHTPQAFQSPSNVLNLCSATETDMLMLLNLATALFYYIGGFKIKCSQVRFVGSIVKTKQKK